MLFSPWALDDIVPVVDGIILSCLVARALLPVVTVHSYYHRSELPNTELRATVSVEKNAREGI